MKKVIVFGLIAVLYSISAIANVNQKLSGSTQLFIAERDGHISLDMKIDGPTLPTRAPLLRAHQVERVIAPAEAVNGVKMVSAFIHVDPNATAQIESLGVIIQERFKKFVVAMIPVDKIESVAQIASVKQVNVARKMSLHSDMSRFYTNTLQVLDYSNAIASGLPCAFTGEGIVVGVIDSGIDFQHAMFMDADGDSRIKQAYVINDSGSFDSYTGEAIYSLTTDNSGESHGTHTSTTAAGSDLTYNGINYGGMAPEADLVLVGLGEDLYETYIAMGIKYVFDYADSHNMPAVCSISLGTMWGPHDGTGEMNELFAEYAGDNPNHILVVSAGNEAGYSPSIGFSYVEGEASAESPFCTVINGLYNATSTLNINKYYAGYECFYNRTPGQQLACKLHVVNTRTNQILWTSDEITEFTIDDFSGINTYFTGLPEVYVFEDDFSGKYNVIVYTDGMAKKSGYTNPKFALAISIYPVEGGPCMIDGWEGYGYNLFANYNGTIDDYVFVSGSDDSSISDHVSGDDVISVGAYVSKNRITDVDGNTLNYSSYYTLNDIAYFSSYQTPGHGPTGKAKPDICAPGAIVVAGINRYDAEWFMDADYRYSLICEDTDQPLGCMQGTSMSAPCVAGIVALYLQAAQSVDKTLNTDDIRDIFAHSAITDEYTVQSNFGPFGKIDALAGIRYILGSSEPVPTKPEITANVDSLDFGQVTLGYNKTLRFKVIGQNLENNVTLSLTGAKYNQFVVTPTEITPEDAANGVTVSVKFDPIFSQNYNATLTISCPDTEDVVIPIVATSVNPAATITGDTSRSYSCYVGELNLQGVVEVVRWADAGIYPPVYPPVEPMLNGANEGVTLNAIPDGGVDNSRYSASIEGDDCFSAFIYGGSATVKTCRVRIFFQPSECGTFHATLTLTCEGAVPIRVSLIGTATVLKSDPVMNPVREDEVTPSSFVARWTQECYSDGVLSLDIECAPQGSDFDPDDPGYILLSGLAPKDCFPSGLMQMIAPHFNCCMAFEDLSSGSYMYRVMANYIDGTSSEWSNVENVTLFCEAPDSIPGDLNGDGVITISDVTNLIDTILNGDEECLKTPSTDVNGDGKVSISDVTSLIDMLLNH